MLYKKHDNGIKYDTLSCQEYVANDNNEEYNNKNYELFHSVKVDDLRSCLAHKADTEWGGHLQSGLPRRNAPKSDGRNKDENAVVAGIAHYTQPPPL